MSLLDDFSKGIFDAVLQVKREFHALACHLTNVVVQEFRGFVEQADCEYCETSWTAPLALVRSDGVSLAGLGQEDDEPKGSKVYIYLRADVDS